MLKLTQRKRNAADKDYVPRCSSNEPRPFPHEDLHNLINDLSYPKDATDLLGFRLKRKKIFKRFLSRNNSQHQNRGKDFALYFNKDMMG